MTTLINSKRSFVVALSLSLAMMTGGCVNTYGANQASSTSVGQASTVRQASVVSVREVRITPDNSIIGSVTGAVLGGLAGSTVGRSDRANTAGAVGGAVAGGLVGNQAGKALNSRPGYAYVVQFENGDLREITQGADIYMAPGSRVNVTFGPNRVVVSPAAL